MGNALIPINDKAVELMALTRHGEHLILKDATKRDTQFHRAYFGLLRYIYELLPKSFKNKCPEDKFYLFIKELQGDYVEYNIGTQVIKEYNSISFGRMSQKKFEEYVATQLPFIYTDIVQPLYPDKYEQIIKLIESEWESFLNKII